jgi:phospholipid/cholesterol/gamma-HCH transport system substrate-binding protein
VAAVNGFDAFGHYLRAALVVNTCSTYSVSPAPGCSANFSNGSGASASAKRGVAADDSLLQRTAAALRGEQAPTTQPTASAGEGASAPASSGKAVTPSVTLPGQGVNGAKGRTQQPTARAPSQPTDPKAGLFNYLLGNDGQ